MPAWMVTVGRFLWDWGRAVVAASSLPAVVVKIVSAVAIGFTALAVTNRVSVSLIPKDADSSQGIAIPWQPSLGVVISGALLVLIFAVAGGWVWARFRSLKIADEVEHSEGAYYLTITNLGFADTTVSVRLEEVAGASGPIQDVNVQLPVELAWWHHGSAVPVLSRGLPCKVRLFQGGGGTMQCGKYIVIGISSGNETRSVTLGNLDCKAKTKLWFKVSFGDATTVRWFSVEPSGVDSTHIAASQFNVRLEDPPHIG